MSQLLKMLMFAAGAIVMSQLASASDWSGKNLVVALKPDKDPEAMLAERGALAEFLASELNCKVEVVVPLSAAVISEGLRNGSIDLAYVSATEMAMLEKSGVAELLLANDFGGRTDYDSIWLVKNDAPYSSIEDLEGQPVAFSSRTSTSGFLIPLLDLQKRGKVSGVADLEEFFGRGNAHFGTGYVSAAEMVLSGRAEAAAVSDYVFLGDKHLNGQQKQALRVLQTQGPVPSHILAVSKRISPEDRALLLKALLTLNEPTNTDLRDRLFTASLVEVETDDHLQTIREALRVAGILD